MFIYTENVTESDKRIIYLFIIQNSPNIQKYISTNPKGSKMFDSFKNTFVIYQNFIIYISYILYVLYVLYNCYIVVYMRMILVRICLSVFDSKMTPTWSRAVNSWLFVICCPPPIPIPGVSQSSLPWGKI